MINKFLNDAASNAHPKIIESLAQSTSEKKEAIYAKARDNFYKNFETTDVYFVATESGSNILGLQACLLSYESIICSESSPIKNYASIGKIIGSQTIGISTDTGKIDFNYLKNYLNKCNQKPSILSISQATEFGYVYSIEEIKAITSLAHDHSLLIHMEASHLANAAAYLNKPLKAITKECDIDVLSFGGTRNGILYGETVLFYNEDISKNFHYYQMQYMQFCAKDWYIAAQYNTLLTDNLWLENARHANAMAQLLANELNSFKNIDVANTQTNVVYVLMEKELYNKLKAKYSICNTSFKENEIKLVTSYTTTQEDIACLIQELKNL